MDIRQEISSYKDFREKYEKLSEKTRLLIKKVAKRHGIKPQNSTNRAKDVESLEKKMTSEAHKDKASLADFHDLAGCRIIFYLLEDQTRPAFMIISRGILMVILSEHIRSLK